MISEAVGIYLGIRRMNKTVVDNASLVGGF